MKFFAPFFVFFLFHTTVFSQINHWETVVYADDIWHYLSPTSQLFPSWSMVVYNDNAWTEGQGSIGYGDGDDNTIIPKTVAVFMRKKFVVVDKTNIAMAILNADYDDGFVAYLNGVEIARSNINGSPPSYLSEAADVHEAVLYNGGTPESFVLSGAILQNILEEGENVLAVQTHNYEGLLSSDLTTSYWLSFGIKDNSTSYGPTPAWFLDPSFSSPLPIVKINTFGVYIPDEPSIEAEMGIIWNGDGNQNSSLGTQNEFFGNIIIDRRGQSSLDLFPKNNFSVETKDENGEDMDVSFLNFPEEEDWVLHGPYSDKTLIRNILAMHLASSMGQYASRTRLVELMINDEYEGVYVLMEKIKSDKNRVDVANLKPEDIEGDELTGGYVIKIDKDAPDWESKYTLGGSPYKIPYQYVSPNRGKIQPAQAAYIQAFMDSCENALYFPNHAFLGKRYYDFIDLNSFAEHFILSEVSLNPDAYRISSYMYKDKNSKDSLLKAGPAWDFNIAFGNADYCDMASLNTWVYEEQCGDGNPFWWGRLLQSQDFKNILKCRWDELRKGPLHLDSLNTFIDQQVQIVTPALNRNFQRWPVLGIYIWPNPQIPSTYAAEIAYLKSTLAARIAWMDSHITGTCVSTGTSQVIEKTKIDIYPNPIDNQLFVKYEGIEKLDIVILIFDVLGRLVFEKTEAKSGLKKTFIELDRADLNLQAGIYFLEIKTSGELLDARSIILK